LDDIVFKNMNSPQASFSQLSDSELVTLAKGRNLEAWDTLISRYEEKVYSLAMRMLRQTQDAEDVTQQTFLNVMEHLDGFRGESSFSTWLLRIATHAALKVIRKRKGLKTISLEESTRPNESTDQIPHPEYVASWKEIPEKMLLSNELKELLDEALAELDEKYRIVFLLRDVEGLSIKETAEAVSLSEANTKIRLLRARLQLREKLTRVLGDPTTAIPTHHYD
jgi:RNA polymerase sigma-70 factor, ECF subfamily